MSPSVAAQLRTDAPTGAVYGFPRGVGANSNAPRKISRPRRRAIKVPLPPQEVRNLAQKIQVADEHWQELIDAHNAERTKESDLALLVTFSCFLHAMIDDKKLCGQLLNYFDRKLESEVRHRIEPVKS